MQGALPGVTDAVCPPLDSPDIKTHTYTGRLTAAALCLTPKCACEANIHPRNIELYAIEIQKDFLSKQLQKLQTT